MSLSGGRMGIKLLYFLALLAAFIGAVCFVASTRPARFRVQRSITINSDPGAVYPLIADFHHWPKWAPQDREDPTMRRNYAGPAAGTGAQSVWQSSGSAGAGLMEIQNATPSSQVRVRVDWTKPFKTTNINTFDLQSNGSGTQVTWTMEGPNLFPMKLMSLFINMDKMMGKHFESGLAQLKSAAEAH